MIFYVEIEEEEPGKETSVPGDLCREFGFDPEKVAYAVGEKTLLLLNKPTNVEVNLKITGDEGIRQCNLLYRQIDSPTDVLSFPVLSCNHPRNLMMPGRGMQRNVPIRRVGTFFWEIS